MRKLRSGLGCSEFDRRSSKLLFCWNTRRFDKCLSLSLTCGIIITRSIRLIKVINEGSVGAYKRGPEQGAPLAFFQMKEGSGEVILQSRLCIALSCAELGDDHSVTLWRPSVCMNFPDAPFRNKREIALTQFIIQCNKARETYLNVPDLPICDIEQWNHISSTLHGKTFVSN